MNFPKTKIINILLTFFTLIFIGGTFLTSIDSAQAATTDYKRIKVFEAGRVFNIEKGEYVEVETAKEMCEMYRANTGGEPGDNFTMNAFCKATGGGCQPVPGSNEKKYQCEWYDKAEESFWKSKNWVYGVLAHIFLFLAYVFQVILDIIFAGVDWCFEKAFNIPANLKAVWTQLRDFVNIIFAFFLVAVAVMNILRIKMDNYAVKKALPAFIAGLILVNLSWILCTLMLDLGNIAYNVILNIAPGKSISMSSLIQTDRLSAMNFIGGDASNFAETPGVAMWTASMAILYFIIIVPTVQLLFVMFVRIIVLWLLFVISPLAWIGFVIPEIRGETWGKFWKALMTMTFLPARVIFYFVIGILILDSYLALAKVNPTPEIIPAGMQAGNMQGLTEMGAGLTDSILLLIMAIVIIKVAAKDAMKTEWTEAAMNIGEKAGKMVQRGAGALATTPATLAGKGIKKASKAGYNKLKTTSFGKTVGGAATKTKDAYRKYSSVLNSDKTKAWKAFDTERNRINNGNMSGSKKQTAMDNAIKTREASLKVAKPNIVSDVQFKADNDLNDAKMNWVNNNPLMSSLWKNGMKNSVSNQWEKSSEYKVALGQKDTSVTAAQKVHDDKKAKIIKGVRTPFTELGHNFATSGAAVAGVKKVWETWNGNMDGMKEESALGWAKGIANIGHLDITGTLKASGFDVKGIQAQLQLKLDNGYSKDIREEKFRDIINTGTRQQIIAKLEEVKKGAAEGSRYDQIAMEHLLHTLEQKHGAYMDHKEALQVEKIWAEIIDKNTSGDYAHNLVRQEFATTSGDRLGALRAKNSNFTNINYGDDNAIKDFTVTVNGEQVDTLKGLYTNKADEVKLVIDPSKMSTNTIKEASMVPTLDAIASGEIKMKKDENTGKYTQPSTALLQTMSDPAAIALNNIADANVAGFAKIAEPRNWMMNATLQQNINIETRKLRIEPDQKLRTAIKGKITATQNLIKVLDKMGDSLVQEFGNIEKPPEQTDMEFIESLRTKVESKVDVDDGVKTARDALAKATSELVNARKPKNRTNKDPEKEKNKVDEDLENNPSS